MAHLVEEMRKGHRLSLARLITKIENRDPEVPQLMSELFPYTGGAEIWGITGPPGAGKSTLVDQITVSLREEQKKVAIVAVDPTSPFSGGAILGDRIRMQRHTHDPEVFIRSLGTRGEHGGLSHATKEVVLTLDAAGFDIILVETAGVGQTELEILKLAQSIVVVLVPESGDSIQVMKAGLMEIADLFAVNKSDRPEADRMVRELTTMVGMTEHDSETWLPPVLKTEAHRGAGVKELTQSIHRHQEYLTSKALKSKKAEAFLRNEVIDILTAQLVHSVHRQFETPSGKEILGQLLARKLDPYEAARLLAGT